VLAYGWAVASGERQTLTSYLGRTGATTVQPFSRFAPFLGGALSQARWQVWAWIIRGAARWGPEGAPSMLIVEDSTKKKAGRPIEGVGHYCNSAGSARQEYRTLRGLNFVGGGRCGCPSPAGPASVSGAPSACRSTSQQRTPASSIGLLRPAVSWLAQSWTVSRLNGRHGGFEA
jgi:hypothetical protein